ncbi:MAG TPA: class I SAM-dependent methyltransferase [Acidimicrobiales bacterium]|jgi:trans-aconitate methyltransferase|nr:class I SAM-dependent methyltransferase [Acidimicrobiales bacterium]
MGFEVSADAYDRFMGRYSAPLAPVFATFCGVESGQRVVDVGCGPGSLTCELVKRLGASSVVAVDPSERFVEAVRERYPGVEVYRASAERLPLPDRAFDAALAELVVHFMADAVAGLREMSRVVTPGGVVAACVWDFEEGGSPLSLFWEAARSLDREAPGESSLPGTRRGHLVQLLEEVGLESIHHAKISVEVEHPSFEEWWQPFELGVGPVGSYVAGLSSTDRRRLAQRCRELLPEPPFVVTASAWAAHGRVAAT